MKAIDLSVAKGAIFSDDRKYRYALWRVWSQTRPILAYIGLNPSIASELSDDPTVTRIMVRANQNGFGGLIHGNLYAYISTNPLNLVNHSQTIGELTDYYIQEIVRLSKIQLCGWGSFKPVAHRWQAVLAILKEPYCLS